MLVSCLELDPVGQLSNLVIDRAALSHKLADLTVGMHHRGVIAAAESLANFRKLELGQFAAEVHRDLAGIYQDPTAA